MNQRWIPYFFLILCVIVINPKSWMNAEEKPNFLVEQLFKRGIQHFNNYDYILASRFFNKVLSRRPGNVKARYWLGRAYYQSGYVEQALQEWKYCLELKKDSIMLKNKLRQYLRQLSTSPQDAFEPSEIYLPSINLLSPKIRKAQQIHIKNPTQVFIDKSLYWILGFGSNNIVILNKNGQKIDELNVNNSPIAKPYRILRNQQGNYLISDYANNSIHVYDNHRNWIKSIPGSFLGPAGMTTDKQGHIYVVDQGNHQIQKLNSNGDFLFQFGKNQLRFPSDIVIIKDHIYVSNTDHARVDIFDLSGSFIQSIGKGLFKKPQGMHLVNDTHILIADPKVGIVSFNTTSLELQKIHIQSDIKIQPNHVLLEDNQFLHINHQSSSNILSFSPKRYQYTNLFTSILQTKTYLKENQFDKLKKWIPGISNDILELVVQHKLEVKDASGNHIKGLNHHNVQLLIDNNKIGVSPISLIPLDSKYDDSHLIVLNEKSLAMKPKMREIETNLKSILKHAKPSDQVELIHFHNQFWMSQESKLSPSHLNYLLAQEIKQGPFKSTVSIGKPLYSSIRQLIRSKSTKKAIIIISSGETDLLFDPYSYETCLNYAKNNHIPIYVIDFNAKKTKQSLQLKMKELAKKTNGTYFHAYTAQDIPRLFQYIHKQKNPLYLLQYRQSIPRKALNRWFEASVQIHYRGLFGQDEIGYYLSK